MAIDALELQPTLNNLPLEGSASYDSILAYCNRQFESCKNDRLQFERNWYLNIAFYFGRQYATWTSPYGTAKLVTPQAPPWRVRLVSNQIRRYIRKEFAKSTKESPTGFVLPASGEDADLMAAKAGDAIIEYLFRETKLQRELKRAVFWAHLCGNGFIKNWYNRKNPQQDSVSDMPAVEKISPFHLFVPDIVQEDIEAQPYVIHCASKPKEWIKNTYGVHVSGHASANSGMVEDKFLQAMGITDKNNKDYAYVKEIWCKPGGYFKDGAVIVWSGSQLLYFSEGWPYSFSDFPVAKIDHIPTGRFYSESIITDLIPLQKEFNRSRSQIIEAKNRMAKPQLIAPLGSIDANKVTSEPGQIIQYRPGFNPPQPLPLQSLPSYVIQEIDRNIIDMDNISSQHEVSRGQSPTGVEAATAISFLQEQDDSVLADLISSIEEATEKIGRQFLHHVNQNWDEARKIQIVGLNQQLEAFEFSRSNLNGNTDYIVQTGSASPRSHAAKQAFILDMMKSGFIHPAQGFKHLDMAETGRLYEEMQIDYRHAQRENLKMSQGVGLPPPVVDPISGEQIPLDPSTLMEDPNFSGFPTNTWDNHVVHIMEHDNWRKRQEYENSPPEIKMLFELHDRTHKKMLCLLYGVMPPDDPTMLNSIVFKLMNNIPVAPVDAEAPPGGDFT